MEKGFMAQKGGAGSVEGDVCAALNSFLNARIKEGKRETLFVSWEGTLWELWETAGMFSCSLPLKNSWSLLHLK